MTMTESFINKLPLEILAYIFCKFSAVYLRSLRRVCKSWDLLIRESSFIEQHFNSRANGKNPGMISLSSTCQSKNEIRRTNYTPNYFSIKFYDEDSNLSIHHEIDMSKYLNQPFYGMTNSCHGLICAAGLVSIIVMNPSIRRLRALPEGSLHFEDRGIVGDIPLVGIGFDPSTRAYKVVRIFRHSSSSERNNNKLSMRCEVYTLGGCNTWKYIGEAPISPHPLHSLNNNPVYVDDVIHWIVRGEDIQDEPPNIVLSFSVKDDAFSLIRHPERHSRTFNSSLAELDGCLSVCSARSSSMYMDVWMLKDYGNRKWVKQYRINSLTIYKCVKHETKPVTIGDGKMVFCDGEGRIDYYDLESKKFIKHKLFVSNNQFCAPYTGSLIWLEDTVAAEYLQQCKYNTSDYNART